MKSNYVPLRKKVEESHNYASQFQSRLDQLSQEVAQLKELVIAVVKSERRIRRGNNGEAIAVDILSPDGNVMHTRNVNRNGGRIAGAK